MSLAENLFLQSQMQQQPQPQNPIEKGAAAGIGAAQQSVAMSDMQRRRAEGAAIMQMSQHMFSPNYGHGLKGAMAAFSGGIEPATHAYLDAETRARAENMMMMERQDKLNKELMHNQLEMQKMKETKRYHDSMIEHRNAKLKENMIPSQTTLGSIDISKYPDMLKTDRTKISNQYNLSAQLIRQLKSAREKTEKFKKDTENNAFAPFGSTLGKYPNMIKEKLATSGSHFAPEKDWVKGLNKEYKDRSLLLSQLKQIEPIIERMEKGGTPDVQLMKRFEQLKIMFSSEQPIEIMQAKIDAFLESAEDSFRSAELSLKTGKLIPPGQNDAASEFKQKHPQYADVPTDKILEAIQKIEAGGGTWK